MQILASMNAAKGTSVGDFAPYQMAEEQVVWRHCQHGLIRQMRFRADERIAAIFVLEADGIAHVRELLSELPLINAGLLVPNPVPLRNFDGLQALFSDLNKAGAPAISPQENSHARRD